MMGGGGAALSDNRDHFRDVLVTADLHPHPACATYCRGVSNV